MLKTKGDSTVALDSAAARGGGRTVLAIAITRLACALVATLAAAVLVGWLLGVDALKRVVPGAVSMNPATALGFIAAAWALAAATFSGSRFPIAGRIAGGAVVLLGVLRLLGYMTDSDIRIDRLLFADRLDTGEPFPNQIAPNTALLFVLVGIGLITLDVEIRRRWRPAEFLAHACGFVATVAILGYAYGVRSFYGVGVFIPMAIHTALAFLLLGLGMLTARPQRGLVRMVIGNTGGGMILRRLLPAVLLIPPVLGWFAISGERMRLFPSAVGVALFAGAIMAALAVLVCFSAWSIDRVDAARHQAEKALSESERKLQAILDNAPAVIYVKSVDGRFTLVNGEFERLVRRGREDVLGRTDHDLFPEQAADTFRGNDLRVIESGRPMEFEEHAGWDESGARTFISLKFPLYNGGLEPYAVCAILTEISERNRVAEELRRAKEAADAGNRAKSEFLAGMSHELRTPLNGVIGMLELLLRADLSPEHRRFAWLAKSSGDMLLALISDVLDFSKIEAGKVELESAEFDLHYLVENVGGSFASRASTKGLKLVCGVHPNVPRLVRGDSGRIQQILTNLVGNAIKFTECGEVVLRVVNESESETAATVRFSVSDTGIGIAPERTDRLFQVFSQVDSSTTRKYGGTGLGLAICKQLVDLIGGEIGVQSEPGRGSTFWFVLKLPKVQGQGSAARSRLDDLRRLRVLAAEGDATNRELLCEQLRNSGLENQPACDAEGALAALREAVEQKRPFAVAILDHELPGGGGEELGRRVLGDAALCDTILILLTSATVVEEPQRWFEAGFAGWLARPTHREKLISVISDALASARSGYLRHRSSTEEAPVCKPFANASTTQARILVAEDHYVSQEVAREILLAAGYACEIVPNGKAATEAFRLGRYDLVLMDCQMPEMDGFEATRLIREFEREHARPRTPVIALTANAIKGDRERCLAAGMDDYTSKPLNPDRLLDTVGRYLSPRTGPVESAAPEQDAGQESPQPSKARAGEPFDLDCLMKRWGNKKDFVRQLVAMFQRRARSETEEIAGAFSAGDLEKVGQAAHAFRGAAANVAADRVRDAAALIEQGAKAGVAAGLEEALAELRAQVDRCLAFAPVGTLESSPAASLLTHMPPA